MKIVTLLSLALITSTSFAQDFVNGDFTGEAKSNVYSTLPDGWEAISYTESFCRATSSVCATVDLASKDAPALFHGNAGKAQSGRTFMSGLLAQSGSHIWHEGMKQTVNGLEPGTKYEISFYQAVVKQDNKSSFHCFDMTGSWSVYVDGVLLETTEPSRSTLSADDISLDWDLRTIEFTASAENHTFYFLPADDDDVIESENAKDGIRMGLDNVSLEIYEEPVAVLEGVWIQEHCRCSPLTEEIVQEMIQLENVERENIVTIEDDHMELLVYPNPTADYARLKVDVEYENLNMQLYDMQGRLIFNTNHKRGDDLRFKLDGERGTYILRVKVDDRDWEIIRVQKAG